MPRIKNKALHDWAGQIKKLFATVERESILLAFLTGLLVAEVAYRVELAVLIYSGTSKLPSLQPAHVPVTAFLKAPLNDLLLTALLGAVYLAGKLWLRDRLPRMNSWKFFPFAEAALAASLLGLITLIMRIHFQLLAQLETGLTMTFVQLSPQMFSVDDFLKLFTLADGIFLVMPLAAFILALMWAGRVRASYKPASVLLILLLLAAQFLPGKAGLPSRIAQSPLVYLADDAFYTEIYDSVKPVDYATRADLPGDAQMNAINLVDPAFVNTNNNALFPARPRALTADGKPWNILIFVLESAGADYVLSGREQKGTAASSKGDR